MGTFSHHFICFSTERKWGFLIIIVQILFFSVHAFPGKSTISEKKGIPANTDTIFVKKGTKFLLFGRVRKIEKDTFFVVTDTSLLIKNPGDRRSHIFYDSIYNKMSRSRITRLLYSLAFRSPSLLPVGEQAVKSEVPFESFRGKMVRKIQIRSLSPFGTNPADTSVSASGFEKALNSMHMNTNIGVIRKNLVIKTGQSVDPEKFSDNERILRSLPYIDNVFTQISPVGQDSVDVTIITRDVWSIGFDITTITTKNAYVRLYDANFLGLGDLLSTNMSFMLKRAPFFKFDRLSCIFTNLAGSFINLSAEYTLKDDGNERLSFGAQRSFFSNFTKWAGGGSFQYIKNHPETLPDSNWQFTFNNDVNIWLGRSFLLTKSKKNSRIVILESYYRRHFTSRPSVISESDVGYFNVTQVFTGIALSRNNYYLSEYVFQFGKPENIPYGSLFQITFGPELNEFYTRYYLGLELAMGNFIRKFGYLSGRLRFGNYFNQGADEDGVIKFSLNYLTPLFQTPDKRYKFRSFLFSDYRYGFNLRNNNSTQVNLLDLVRISEGVPDSVFKGKHAFSINFSSVMYTPWYFYGFRFGLIFYYQGGIVSKKENSIFSNPFFSGIGLGVLIKNENLIFPTLMITGFIYPNVKGIQPYLQTTFINDLGNRLQDFNPSGPRVESINN